jgi:imidazolonepropionase-like amidohydrolase
MRLVPACARPDMPQRCITPTDAWRPPKRGIKIPTATRYYSRMTEPETLTLWNARLVDGAGSTPHGPVAVHVRYGRIHAIDEAPGDQPPEGALDVAGRTVMPGLIDAHVHALSDTERSPGFGPPPPLHGEEPRADELRWFILAKAGRAWLRAGLTTIRDVGAFDDEALILREAIRLGLTEGPRILSCARIVTATAPGGRLFTTMYEEADGPWEMRRAVRRQLRRGADYIKVMATGARSVLREDPEPAQMTGEELHAAVDEAHRMGVRVAAHAEGLAGARLAIEAGVDTIEHGLSLHRDPALLGRMAAAGTVLVPTLSTFHDLAERFEGEFAPALVEQAKRQLDEAYLTLCAAHQAGVTLAMGYDSGPPGTNAAELVRMADGGIGAMAAITAATAGGAAALGLDDRGRVAPGMVADLLVVDGDPLADPAVLSRLPGPWLVIQGGRIVAGDEVLAAAR